MKKEYLSPEVEIICFAPVEKLANNDDWWTDTEGSNWVDKDLGGDDGDGE